MTSAIRALVSGYPRRLWGEKLLVMLQAYVDDSIARTGNRQLRLSGYVMTVDEWIRFSDAWDEALSEAPAIPYFKMAEANGRSRDGCFGGFSVAERNKKVFHMAQVVKRFGPHSISATVNISEFDRLLKPYVPYPVQTPYFVLCHALIHGIAQMHEQLHLRMKCEVIFDDHPGLAAKILPAWDLYAVGVDSWRDFIAGPPTFRDDKEVLPLQAADLLAWHLRRSAEGIPAPDYPGILDMLLIDRTHHLIEIGTATLEHLGEQFRNHPTMHKVLKRKDWVKAEEMVLQLFYEAQRLRGEPFANLDQAEAESIALAQSRATGSRTPH